MKRAQAPVTQILTGGGRLGISVRDVEDEDVKAARLAAPAGAVVEAVSEGSAAEKGGLRTGDIVTEFDGERVRSARQLARLVQETAEGRKVPAVVMRDGQRLTLTIEPTQSRGGFQNLRDLEEWGRNFSFELPARRLTPTPRAETFSWHMDDLVTPRSVGRLGLTVDTLSPQLAGYFGTKEGVLVTSVADGSVAARTGLKAGDVITSLNGSTIDNPADLRRRLQALEAGAEMTIEIVRDKKAQTLKGKLENAARRRTYRSII